MKLKPLKPDKLIKILGESLFKKVRQKGSHVFLKHSDGRTTIVPIHKGELIGRGLLRKIINDIDMTRDKFIKFIEKN